MRKLFTFLIIGSLALTSYGQGSGSNEFIHKNSIQLEALGHGFLSSINYERILSNSNRIKISAQTGYAYQFGAYSHWFPTSVNFLLSSNKHHLEIGLGIIIANQATWSGTTVLSRQLQLIPIGRLGYRYQKPDGKFIFRLGFTPIGLENSVTDSFFPWGGLSFGYAF